MRFRASAYYLGRIRHSGDDLLDSFDRIVAMSFDLRKFVEYDLRQFALLKIEDSVVPEQESLARLLFGLLGSEVLRLLIRVFDFPEDYGGRTCRRYRLVDQERFGGEVEKPDEHLTAQRRRTRKRLEIAATAIGLFQDLAVSVGKRFCSKLAHDIV